MSNTYNVTLSNGKTITRKTNTTYTHAAIKVDGNGKEVVSFHASYELAVKGAEQSIEKQKYLEDGIKSYTVVAL